MIKVPANRRRAHGAIAIAVAGSLGLLAILAWSGANNGRHAIASASSRVDASSTPNIILIVSDALRPDHISAYGYGHPTTPNLDARVAQPGVIFADATAPSAWTLPSNAALFTGRSPDSIGVTWSDPNAVIPQKEVMLPEYLHQAGYYTAGFVSTHYVKAHFGFNQGFDVYTERVISGESRTRASDINEIAMDWLESTWTPVLSGTQPLFLFLYYFDPHTWYNPPAPFDTLYDATYTGTLTAQVYADGQDVVSRDITPTARDVEHLLALYDGEITYWDVYFEEMMAFLEGIHLLDQSIIIVTSDHGEMFGEHEQWTHRNALYEEVLRVPLLIRYSGVISAGLVITSPVQTMDITPTVLDWIGLPIPANLHGMSLTSLAQGQPMTETREIYAEMDAITHPDIPGYWLAPRYESRSVRRGDWKYIHYLGLANADELYRLRPTSPFETENLIASEPEIADSLFQALVDWFDLPTRHLYLPMVNRGDE